LCKSREQD